MKAKENDGKKTPVKTKVIKVWRIVKQMDKNIVKTTEMRFSSTESA